MSEVLFVDVWSDVICPFCYLGTRQLAEAIRTFEHGADVVVRHRAFELDPRAPHDSTYSLAQLLAKKYAMSVERAQALNEGLEREASALGMTWALSNARPGNTFDAHRLVALAGEHEKEAPMIERLFRAYFCEGLLISDHDVLDSLAREVGVDDSTSLWSSDRFVNDVRGDEEEATQLGIGGVPSLLIDGKFMVVGAQDAAQMRRVLERAWERRRAA